MDYLDKDKLQKFNEAMKDREASRALSRGKDYPSPAEIREEARKQREAQEKNANPWNGMK